MSNVEKNFNILATNLSILHNYLSGPKLFSDLYLAKFLDCLSKIVISVYLFLNHSSFWTN